MKVMKPKVKPIKKKTHPRKKAVIKEEKPIKVSLPFGMTEEEDDLLDDDSVEEDSFGFEDEDDDLLQDDDEGDVSDDDLIL